MNHGSLFKGTALDQSIEACAAVNPEAIKKPY